MMNNYRLTYYGLLGVFMMPAFPPRAQVIIIAAFTIIILIENWRGVKRFNWNIFLVNSSLFLCYLISLIYTENLAIGLKKLESAASIIVFAFCFALIPNEVYVKIRAKSSHFSAAFIIATLAFSIIKVIWLLSTSGSLTFDTFYEASVNDPPYGNVLPIYFNLILGTAILLVFSLVREKKQKYRFLFFAAGLLLTVIIVAFAHKGTLIALILVCILLTSSNRFRHTRSLLFSMLGITAATIMLNFASTGKVPSSINVSEIPGLNSTLELREAIKYCSQEVFDNSLFLGYGVGDGKEQLVNCLSVNHEELGARKFNSHNQYLGMLLNIGIAGVLTFLICLLRLLKKAWKTNALISIAILLFYCLIMFSENILERQNGIIYFSFFLNSYLIFANPKETTNQTNHSQNH